MSGASTDAKRRVKLYALNASRQWDDKGTGHVTTCYHEPLDGMSLLVRNESDGSLLLESKIQSDTHYQKQQGTLIVWTESDNYDLALSFQEQDGCVEIWEKICQVQGRDPSYEQDQDEEQEEVRISLVECDHDKLQLILEQINAFSQTTRRRDVLANEYIENDYVQKLLVLFHRADEKQDIPTLHKLYEIFKQLFLYDRPTLTEVMLSENLILDVIGIFEYEPMPQQEENSTQQENIEEDNEVKSTPMTDTDELVYNNNNENNNNIDDVDSSTSISIETSDVDINEQQSKTDITSADLNQEQKHQELQPSPIEQGQAEQPNQQQQHQDQQHEQQQSEEQQQPQQQPEEQQQQQQPEEQQQAKQQQPEHQQQQQQQTVTPMQAEPQDQQETQSHNSQLKTHRKRHREFLQNGTTFKEVISFNNQKLVDKIHQTYRVQYLQSSVLPTPSILEENAYAALTNILFFNKVEIVTMIQENIGFLQDLFNQIISNETGLERKRELVLFLREYCIFSQTIQPKQRESFFKTLASLKILSAVEVALSSNDQVVKSAAIDIFTYLVEYSPHMTREHAVQQREGIIEPPNSNAQTANILKLVIEHITTDKDPELGTATQLSCIVRLLLDPENMPGDAIGKHSFLEFFYFTCMQSLVEPIRNSTKPGGDIEPSANDRKTAHLLSIMLELLTFFMEHHYSQLRNYIVSNDLLTRIIGLIKSRHKFLVLSVVRFFRRLIATKDEVYFELILNEDLFGPIIQVLKNNNGRYNLLDSAILELFEYIQSENLLTLMEHVLTNFGPFLESIEYVNTFKVMRQKKEALHDTLRDSDSLKPNRSSIENSQLYFGSHSRRNVESLWYGSARQDRDEVEDDGPVNANTDKDFDLDLEDDSDEANSDPNGLNMPDLEFTMNGGKNDDEEVEDEDVDEEVEDEDDIQMDEEDCDDELEPQFKKKKTK